MDMWPAREEFRLGPPALSSTALLSTGACKWLKMTGGGVEKAVYELMGQIGLVRRQIWTAEVFDFEVGPSFAQIWLTLIIHYCLKLAVE